MDTMLVSDELRDFIENGDYKVITTDEWVELQHLREQEKDAREGLSVKADAQGWDVFHNGEWVEFVPEDDLMIERAHALAVLFLCDEAEKLKGSGDDGH